MFTNFFFLFYFILLYMMNSRSTLLQLALRIDCRKEFKNKLLPLIFIYLFPFLRPQKFVYKRAW